jgi:ketosteroid isomerase-like protein
MVENLRRQRVLNFLDAFYAGDIEGALAHCSDDVDFLANAPIDILPHMGHRRGKAEVRQMWQTVHARYSSMRYELPIIVAEGDKVAVIIRVFFRKRNNDRRAIRPRGVLHPARRPDRGDPRDPRYLRSGAAGAGT